MMIQAEGPNGSIGLACSARGSLYTELRPSVAVDSGGALAKSLVLKASDGVFRSLYVQLDPTLASGTYYVQLLTGTATVPADGAVTHLRPPQTIVHTIGSAEGVNFDEGDSGIPFTVGCVAVVSTTQFTKTIAGSNCATFAGSIL